ncbi:Kinase/pyrophosphorylase-domain-containing protein [Haematococcus lacustris]
MEGEGREGEGEDLAPTPWLDPGGYEEPGQPPLPDLARKAQQERAGEERPWLSPPPAAAPYSPTEQRSSSTAAALLRSASLTTPRSPPPCFPSNQDGPLPHPSPSPSPGPPGLGPAAAGGRASDSLDNALCVVPKPIFIISDCTGESAARTVRAALNQFELCFKTSAPASIFVWRFVEEEQKVYRIIQMAAKDDALVVYTLVDPGALKAVQTACKLHSVRNVDLWSNLLDCMEAHLDATRSGVPMSHSARRPVLTEDYFKMIEAVEYTRKQDDGANPADWQEADLLVLGVSRSGKTPLCIFLGQRGYKVANLPLVPGLPLPKELFQIDQSRIVGLTIDPNVLMTIRRNRVGQMGLKDFGMPIDYHQIKKVVDELAWAKQLYAQHPEWAVLDVTYRGVEESAARILKILNDRRGDASPQWVEELHGPRHTQPSSSGVSRPLALGAEQIYAGGEQFLAEGLY